MLVASGLEAGELAIDIGPQLQEELNKRGGLVLVSRPSFCYDVAQVRIWQLSAGEV
jgi:hypothetical protein